MKPKININLLCIIAMIAMAFLTNYRCSGKSIEKLPDSLQTMGTYSNNTEEVQKHVMSKRVNISRFDAITTTEMTKISTSDEVLEYEIENDYWK